jgi:hypothetical protein
MLVRARLLSIALALGTSTFVATAGADMSIVPVVASPVPVVAAAVPVVASPAVVLATPASLVAMPLVDPATCAAAGPFACSFFYRRAQAHMALGHYTNPYYLTEPGRAVATVEADCAAARGAPEAETSAAVAYFLANGAPERAFVASSCRAGGSAPAPRAPPAPIVAVVATPAPTGGACAPFTPGAAPEPCRPRVVSVASARPITRPR